MTTLDELRRANLQEQHRSAGTQATPPLTIKEALGNPNEEEEAAKAVAAPEAVVPSSVPAVIETPVKAPSAPKAASQNGRTPPAEEKAKKESDIVERVHQALVRKVIHPTGVKATVDMPPELFWRLKRYCRDHNNATLRQVFLDVMMAYLDEEGY